MKITITAASGKLGHAVAHELSNRGLTANTRLAARTPEKLSALQTQGFEVVAADYEDAGSVEAALKGAELALIISSEGVNEKRFRHHKTAIDAAKKAGVGRIVYTSATNPTHQSYFEWAGAHEDTETYLKKTGIPYTILRDNAYFSNNDALFEQAIKTGAFAFPNIHAKVAYISHEDVARAIAGAITGSNHENRTYEISGHEAVAAIDLAAILSEITGDDIKAVDVPLQAFSDQFRAMGLPEEIVTGVTSFYATLGAGEYSQTSEDVEQLSGQQSTSAQEYLKEFVNQRK